jgi:hypothetical protein
MRTDIIDSSTWKYFVHSVRDNENEKAFNLAYNRIYTPLSVYFVEINWAFRECK